MKNFLFYAALLILLMLTLSRLLLIISRKILLWSEKRKAAAVKNLTNVRKELAAAKNKNFEAKIVLEITSEESRRKSEKSYLN